MKPFIDRVELTLKSGDGGAGIVSFRREKFVPKGGADGGDGGRGGDVIVRASARCRTLHVLLRRDFYEAQKGNDGLSKKRKGRDASTLTIDVPLYTVVRCAHSGRVCADLMHEGESVVLLRGAVGGKGNARFTSSTRQTPRYAQLGRRGLRRKFVFEFELQSDISLVGKPNVGKSTLLKVLTNATPKIGNYPFTTLSPNVGSLVIHDYEIILSDIPGIVEGASEGKGLGMHFLKHLRRSKAIAFVLDGAVETIDEIIRHYTMLKKEVEKAFTLLYPTITHNAESVSEYEGFDDIRFTHEAGGWRDKKMCAIISRVDITGLSLSMSMIERAVKTRIRREYDESLETVKCVSAHDRWGLSALKETMAILVAKTIET